MSDTISLRQTEITDEPFLNERSLGEVFEAAYNLGNMDSTVSSLVNLRVQEDMRLDGLNETVDPEVLNKEFPGMPEPFSERMSRKQAAFIHDRHLERERLSFIMANGPSGGAYEVLKFGAAMVPHVLDPVDAIVGLGVGKVLGFAVGAAKTGRAIKAASRLSRFTRDVSEGLIGNLAVEPLVYKSNKQDLQDYGAEEALINAVAGAVGYAGIKHGIGKAIDKIKGLGEARYEIALRSYGNQLLNGDKPDIELFIKEKAIQLGGESGDYSYIKKTNEDLIKEPLYIGSKVLTNDVQRIETDSLSRNLGEGLYLTDNKKVANTVAYFGDMNARGGVVEVRMSDIKTADLDDADEFAKLKEVVELATGQKFDKAKTLGDVVEQFKGDQNQMAKVNFALGELGYDGYRWGADNFEGEAHAPNNQVMLFNRDKITDAKVEKANADNVSSVSDQELNLKKEEHFSHTKDSQYDPELEELVNKNIQESPPEVDVNSLIKDIDDYINDVADLERQGLADEDMIEAVAMFKKERDSLVIQDEMVKAATVCFTSGR